MNDIINRYIGEWGIKQRKSDGYINGDSLARSGNKDFEDFLALQKTQRYLTELSSYIMKEKGNLIQGDWVHPEIALVLAYWLSPKHTVIVFEWVRQWLLDDYSETEELSDFNKALKQALNFNPKEN